MTVITYTGTSMPVPFKLMRYYINQHTYGKPEDIVYFDNENVINLIL
jgi:hypothetical protein